MATYLVVLKVPDVPEVVLTTLSGASSKEGAIRVVSLTKGLSVDILNAYELAEVIPTPSVPERKFWEIWAEGFIASGDSGKASLMGGDVGCTFQEACDNLAKQYTEFRDYYDRDRMTHWGCRLYSTEKEARKRFG